jgi:hypothetical protein
MDITTHPAFAIMARDPEWIAEHVGRKPQSAADRYAALDAAATEATKTLEAAETRIQSLEKTLKRPGQEGHPRPGAGRLCGQRRGERGRGLTSMLPLLLGLSAVFGLAGSIHLAEACAPRAVDPRSTLRVAGAVELGVAIALSVAAAVAALR